MALNFPDTPALNQTFTANNVTWRWTGTYWKSQGTGASLYIGDSAPTNPAGGTMWFESTTGKTYVYYKDADGNQWVELGGSSASTALTLGAFTTSNLAEGSNLYFTTARATAAARSAITVSGAATYDSGTGVLNIGGNIISVNGQTGAVVLNTSDIAEDASLYFTPARARSSISVTGPASYDTATGVITVQGNINSVNGQANAVTLTTTDIPEGTNQYFTTARARAAISATGIASYDSATGVISLTTGIPRITGIVVTDSSYVVTGATTLTSGATGYIKLTGTDFVLGSQVYVNTTAASSTTFVSSTEVRAALPSQSAGSYLIYLVGTDGATAISVSGVTFIAEPPTTTTSAPTTTTTSAPTTTTTSAPTTTTTTPAPATVEYLVVAGGGGGASAITSDSRGGGGGGAGGFRTGSATNYQRGSVYSITVGGGGPGATALGNDGSNGNPSSFDTISSISGGGGGSQGRVGKDGGSGGGGSGGSGGGAGTAGQGFRGGSSSSSGTTSGGGGGGSFGVGADGGGSYFSGTAGGAGTINAITGTNVTYAAGGRGGGGNGDSPVAAADNSGNGGLGGGNPNGGNGGSGIVVIAYPNTFPALQSVSAGLAYDQPVRSGYRVYRFTSGTGTITW